MSAICSGPKVTLSPSRKRRFSAAPGSLSKTPIYPLSVRALTITHIRSTPRSTTRPPSRVSMSNSSFAASPGARLSRFSRVGIWNVSGCAALLSSAEINSHPSPAVLKFMAALYAKCRYQAFSPSRAVVRLKMSAMAIFANSRIVFALQTISPDHRHHCVERSFRAASGSTKASRTTSVHDSCRITVSTLVTAGA